MSRHIFFWDSDIEEAYRQKKDLICAVNCLPATLRLFVETNYPGTQFVNFGPTCGMTDYMEWCLWGWNKRPQSDQTGLSHVDWQTTINGVRGEQIALSE